MGKKDPRIDAYIAKANPFAPPILKHLRKVIHSASPEITETMKWSHPSFEYKGLLCGLAAFKEHATFGFWMHEQIVPKDRAKGAWGTFGRITSVKDLPPDKVLVGYIRKAMKLKDEGVKATHMVNRKKHKPLPVPADLKTALSKDAKAKAGFEAFSPSAQRDYIEWLIEAKTPETRERRLLTAVEWMAEGKRRNWKYETKK
ncbi:MAG TPA: YdeI/OmpD-associated family protein [Gemmataceae bacterium]|nr:YdeI/OmpD-associated family protein [Gemmataceae bacterium]